MIQWPFGSDTAHVVKKAEDPNIPKPEDLNENEKSKIKIRIWNAKVDQYAAQIMQLNEKIMRSTC